jgi:hypothetical protein
MITDVRNPLSVIDIPGSFVITNQTAKTLSKLKNNPRVSQFIGKVKNLITGITVQLRIVKMTTNNAALDIPETSKFERRFDRISKARVLPTKYTRVFIQCDDK